MGLRAVYVAGLVHRDIKPENVFVHQGTAKLADLGLAAKVETTDSGGSVSFQGVAGTLSWMAPEQLEGGKGRVAAADARYGRAVDVWSMGLTCLSVALARQVTTTVVLQAAKREAVMGEIMERGRPLEFRALCESMLQVEPGERPTPVELCGLYGFEAVVGVGSGAGDDEVKEFGV